MIFKFFSPVYKQLQCTTHTRPQCSGTLAPFKNSVAFALDANFERGGGGGWYQVFMRDCVNGLFSMREFVKQSFIRA